jgi:hypothetical protein
MVGFTSQSADMKYAATEEIDSGIHKIDFTASELSIGM